MKSMERERATSALRYAVIGYCVLFACTLAVSTFAPYTQTGEEIVQGAPSGTILLFSSLGVFGALIGAIVGSIAMLAHQRWGLWVHLISNLVGVTSSFGLGHVLVSSWASSLNDLLMTLSGLIYGIGFFTKALDSGNPKSNQPPQITSPASQPPPLS